MEKTKTLADTIRERGEAHDYSGQAEALLSAAGVLYVAEKAVPQLAPAWAKDGKHGIQWSITLAKLREKPGEGQYIGSIADNRGHIAKEIQFFFWGSIADKEKAEHGIGKKPRAYDVLGGLYMQDLDTFEDFCANLGYSEDSREAERTYREVRELNAKIESIFTSEELAALAEIA